MCINNDTQLQAHALNQSNLCFSLVHSCCYILPYIIFCLLFEYSQPLHQLILTLLPREKSQQTLSTHLRICFHSPLWSYICGFTSTYFFVCQLKWNCNSHFNNYRVENKRLWMTLQKTTRLMIQTICQIRMFMNH